MYNFLNLSLSRHSFSLFISIFEFRYSFQATKWAQHSKYNACILISNRFHGFDLEFHNMQDLFEEFICIFSIKDQRSSSNLNHLDWNPVLTFNICVVTFSIKSFRQMYIQMLWSDKKKIAFDFLFVLLDAIKFQFQNKNTEKNSSLSIIKRGWNDEIQLERFFHMRSNFIKTNSSLGVIKVKSETDSFHFNGISI